MKIKNNDAFIDPKGNKVTLTDCIDGDHPRKNKRFSFVSGENVFYCVRQKNVTKANGWKRVVKDSEIIEMP